MHPKTDELTMGKNALYFQRDSTHFTKSRLSKLTGQKIYQFMTIRNWNTSVKLLEMASE